MTPAELALSKATTVLQALDAALLVLNTHPSGAREKFARRMAEEIRPYADAAVLSAEVAVFVAALP